MQDIHVYHMEEIERKLIIQNTRNWKGENCVHFNILLQMKEESRPSQIWCSYFLVQTEHSMTDSTKPPRVPIQVSKQEENMGI